LNKKSIEKLSLHSISIRAIKAFTIKEIVNNILQVEFPEFYDVINDKIPKLTYDSMKSVLRTLDDSQIHAVAYSNGVKNPSKYGKAKNIDIILRREFPKTIIKPVTQLVEGRNVIGWDLNKRKSELQGMNIKELKIIALTIGSNMSSDISNKQLIKNILGYEEYVAKLIPIEDMEKVKLIDKIIKISDKPEPSYELLSLTELKELLSFLVKNDKKYLNKMEKERLYNLLAQFVDINNVEYVQANTWDIKKLRKKLEIVAGFDWESYVPLIEDYSFVKCMQKFDQYNWIEGKVTGVWLANPDGSIPNNDYILKDIYIEEQGHFWYQANKQFFALQCNSYMDDRTQTGDVLVTFTQTRKKIEFKVGFTVIGYKNNKYKSNTRMVTIDGKMVQRTFITQDEVLFRKEKETERYNKQTEVGRVKDILNSIVTERTTNIGKKLLSNALLEIAPMKNDYGIIRINSNGSRNTDYNTPYIQILMNTLRGDDKEQSNKEFFTKVASLLVFINTPEAKTFRKNIEHEYYLPDILATLSPEEKFPEAFQDPNASDKFLDELTTIINNNIYKIIRQMAMSEYNFQDPTRKKNTNPSSIYLSRPIKISKRINACVNKARVNDVQDQDIVYYKENDNIYCFSVDELYKQILIDGNHTNPETGKQFDDSFVKRFDQLYNKRLSNDGFLTTYFQKKYGFDMDELVKEKEIIDTRISQQTIIAKNLWEIIRKDVEELENQLSNMKAGDDEEIDEDREEERRDSDVNKESRESRDIELSDACVYCKTHLSSDSIKSIILHGDESRIIKFCSFKCFENKNDWNKFKAKAKAKTKTKAKAKAKSQS
jgi:hypothetical protein